MRGCKTALLIAMFGVLGQPALGGGWDNSCDWYENAVVGTRCAQSWSFGVTVDYNQFNYARNAYDSTDGRYNTTGSFAITPTSWLTVSFGSQFVSDDHNWSNGWFNRQGHWVAANGSSSSSWTGAQTLQANVNLVDTGPGAQRFVINAYGGGSVTPSHENVDENDVAFAGITANGQWHIGSGMSVVAQGQLQLNGVSQDDATILYPHGRLLLSNDALGLAVGPVFNSGQWLGGSQATPSQSAYHYFGGTAIAQPFRSSTSPLLNGVILQVTGQETLGQAGWVSPSYAKTDQFDVSGTVGFHFRY